MIDSIPAYRIATVISSNDASSAPSYIVAHTGCIKIRILPELADVADDDLPWAMPDHNDTGTKDGFGEHNPPQEGSLVRVRIEDLNLKQIYYTGAGPLITDAYPYNDAVGDINIDDYAVPSYPEPHLKRLPDGTILFWDTTTGDMGIQHLSGSWIFVNADGKISISGAGIDSKAGTSFFTIAEDGAINAGVGTSGPRLQLSSNAISLSIGSSISVVINGSSMVITIGTTSITFSATGMRVSIAGVTYNFVTHIHMTPTGPSAPPTPGT